MNSDFETYKRDPRGCSNDFYEDEIRAEAHATFSFRETDSGALELVASTPLPWLRVDTSLLTRGPTGWLVETPPAISGCMAYYQFDEYLPDWSVPSTLELRFSGADSAGRSTELELSARFDEKVAWTERRLEGRTLEATGERDDVAPRVWQAGLWSTLEYQGDITYEPTDVSPLVWDFSEPLQPDWAVALMDDAGRRWPVATSADGDDFELGFTVGQYFPPGMRWVFEGQDMAGNPLQLYGAPETGMGLYLGDALVAIDGEFETVDECFAYSGCGSATLPGHSEVKALSGARSLSLEQGSFRVKRSAGSTSLRLQARVIAAEVALARPTFALRTMLPGSKLGWSEQQSLDGWEADETILDQTSQVSLLRQISLPLPPGDEDILFHVDSGAAAFAAFGVTLWLDSVRTE